jgi:hypothetical protein
VLRGRSAWLVALAGVIAVIIVSAAIGGRDESGETVTAGEWVQHVCGAVGVWRGEIDAALDDVRKAPATGATGTEEPQSETPQGRTGFIRTGLERAVLATETLVEGIDNAGIPETEEGEATAEQVSEWADSAREELEEAEETLENEAETLEDVAEQHAEAAAALGTVLGSGVDTLLEVTRNDPELAAAFRDSYTCEQVREEVGE